MSSEKQYINLVAAHRQLIDSHSAEPLNRHRDTAQAYLAEHGLPTRHTEEYRYTNIEALLAPNYGLNLQRIGIDVDPTAVFRCDVPNLSTLLFFLVNDTMLIESKRGVALPEGLEISKISDFCSKNPDFIERYYNRQAARHQDAMTSLNTMLCQDGLVVRVRRGCRIDKTVQILNLLRSDVPLMVNRRVIIVVEPDAEARLLFCDHAVDKHEFLTTQTVEVYLEERARLDLYCMEETHSKCSRISNVLVSQKEGSHFAHHSHTLSCGQTRNSLIVDLDERGAECSLCGLVIADETQHVDNNTLILHHSPCCQSHELYKYVLDDNAVGAFAGKVLVEKGAQKTVSDEVNQNLCMSREARMFTQPMLEIYADDVKCSHGSTVGQLSEAAMFYMRQRGLSPHEAQQLLKIAFAAEVVDKVELTPLRDRLHYLVEKRFRGELGHCASCKKNR